MNDETSMQVDLRYIRRDIDEIKKKLDGEYVTKSEFVPVQRLVYGITGLVMTLVITALVMLVLKVK